MLPNPQSYFADLPDPRRETKNKLHKLEDIVMIVLCAVLSGIEDWVGMELFAEEREAWFRRFLALPNGIPSHDTLSDVMGRINPVKFREAFLAWVEVALPCLAGHHVALDGQTLRGSRGKGNALHLMSAFACEARWVVAQCAVDDKSNEIRAIPELLSLLDLEGATVTIDAIGCQKAIAQQVIEAKANYVLALKDNHPQLHEEVKLWLETEQAQGHLPCLETVEKDHGRLEQRRYWISAEVDWLPERKDWLGLSAVGMVEAERHVAGKVSTERRYFLCSFDDLPRFATVVRNHWRIENSQHWVLDVQFGEDHNRTRLDHAPENLALIRRTALNLVRQNGEPKESLKRRRLRASLNDAYRWQLLTGST
jgi:predicted transposase YbfD/YdcC